ncbi:triacylglycerol lipase [Synechococcus sp. ROS8604]|uniref:esterase/lipase family protein n=1 Tax=Synechococcus sp. ROS8604 TaxID=1442557 RepID=UPI001648237D|nr:esterase [Synechococcus sp. ROS8604]QNI87452.1 alpha/beta hydrolase family protein [Synechococcus sp. ROS8604]
MRTVDPQQPVVILGGFLITAEAYEPMAEWLKHKGICNALVVPMSRLDWLLTIWRFGWRRVLDRVDDIVKQVQHHSLSGKVTLIGHSSGGVMLRLYLSDEPFEGRIYAGSKRCDRLVTLGSPHQAVRATPLRAMVDRRFPGCHESDVDYVAIAGKLDLSSGNASAFSRRGAKASYQRAIDDEGCLGDGLVPVESALLTGARSLIQDDTAHGGLFGDIWYASTQRLEAWWDFVVGSESSQDKANS